jgi:hypothetical protein
VGGWALVGARENRTFFWKRNNLFGGGGVVWRTKKPDSSTFKESKNAGGEGGVQ